MPANALVRFVNCQAYWTSMGKKCRPVRRPPRHRHQRAAADPEQRQEVTDLALQQQGTSQPGHKRRLGYPGGTIENQKRSTEILEWDLRNANPPDVLISMQLLHVRLLPFLS